MLVSSINVIALTWDIIRYGSDELFARSRAECGDSHRLIRDPCACGFDALN